MEKIYNLSAPEWHADPCSLFARLRREGPTARVRVPFIGEGVALLRHADVFASLKDERLFNDPRTSPGAPQLPHQWWVPSMMRAFFQSMLFRDPPDHRRLRDLVHKAFTPRRVEALAVMIERIVNELLDAAAKKGQVDLIADFALPLPLQVISQMMGVPEDERMTFHTKMEGLLDSEMSLVTLLRHNVNSAVMDRFFRRIIRLRREQPGDDLLTGLVQAEADGDRLNENELISMVFLLLFAGHETTVNLIGNGTLALLQHPDQFAKLRAHPELVTTAVEELLRFSNPVTHASPRYARAELTIHGRVIPTRTFLLPLIASANRDEEAFPHADTLDIARYPNHHITFGHGAHFCIGAPLSRLEGKIAFHALVQRFPGMKLATPPEKLSWRRAVNVRGLRALPLHLA